MTGSQHRALIFGDAAETYDEVRPDYPVEAVDHILGQTRVKTAVEIGAGTGKATSGFAREGLEITCLEPSPAMATVLRRRNLPGVVVAAVSFEDWNGPGSPVDLIYAAQSWHWVDHSTAYQKAKEMLRPGGVLALMWNVPLDRYTRFVEVYRELGPEVLSENDRRIGKRDGTTWLGDLEKSGFRSPKLFVFPWSADLSPMGFRQLCSTYSDHMMIPEPRRTALLDALETAVAGSGGTFTVEYEARVFTGTR